MSELAFLSATELVAKIKARTISSQELLRHYLARVDKFNGEVNAIVLELRDEAMARAEAADEALARGEDWGRLHGLPITCKESYEVTGTAATRGSPDFKNNIATTDATVITRLKDAGAILFGKTNVPLALADLQSYNDVYGTTNNPWDLSRTPGGSSGGPAAALAAGMSALEMGSDIGGSIRNPAHYCGVFGHKPTWGLLPLRGHGMPGTLAPSDLAVIGPLARSAHDLETAVRVTAGPDELMARGYRLRLPTLEKGVDALRVAVWRDDPTAPVSREVSARVDRVARALADLGASVDPDARPEFDVEEANLIYWTLLSTAMSARQTPDAYRMAVEHAESLDPQDQSLAAQLARANVARFADWAQNNEKRTRLRWAWHEFFKNYDVLIAPIAASSAFPHDHRPMSERTICVDGEEQDYFKQVFWSGLASGEYLPSTAIPTGPDENGLPIGVQIMGPEYGDLITIGVAKLLEAAGFRFAPPPGY